MIRNRKLPERGEGDEELPRDDEDDPVDLARLEVVVHLVVLLPDVVRVRVGGARVPDAVRPDYTLPFKDAKARLLEIFERRYWRQRLEAASGNVSEAARQGGIHRKSLEYLVKKLDLKGRPGE